MYDQEDTPTHALYFMNGHLSTHLCTIHPHIGQHTTYIHTHISLPVTKALHIHNASILPDS